MGPAPADHSPLTTERTECWFCQGGKLTTWVVAVKFHDIRHNILPYGLRRGNNQSSELSSQLQVSQPPSQATSSGTTLAGSSAHLPGFAAAAKTGAPASLPGQGLAQALENRQVAGLAEDVQAAIQVCASGLERSWKGAGVLQPNQIHIEDSESRSLTGQ